MKTKKLKNAYSVFWLNPNGLPRTIGVAIGTEELQKIKKENPPPKGHKFKIVNHGTRI